MDGCVDGTETMGDSDCEFATTGESVPKDSFSDRERSRLVLTRSLTRIPTDTTNTTIKINEQTAVTINILR